MQRFYFKDRKDGFVILPRGVLRIGIWFLWFLPSVVLGQESVQIVQENEYSPSIEISEGDDKNLGDFRIEISDGLTEINPELWSWDMGGVDLFRLPDVPFEDESNDFVSDVLIGPVWDSGIAHLAQDWMSIRQKNQSQESVTILEGNSRKISWTLSSPPSSDVTVTITGYENTDLIVRPNQLTFTNLNWNIAQEVTLTANHDNDAIHESVIPLSFTNSGGDTSSEELTVEILDDEIPWQFPPRAVREGENIRYSVWLLPDLAPPTGDVTFMISGHQGTDLVPESEAVTFPLGTWQQTQPLKIATNLDNDDTDDMETLTLTASGGGYEGLKYIAEITITDRRPFDEYIPEGNSIQAGPYRLRSNRKINRDLVVTLSGFTGTDLTVDPVNFTLWANSWRRYNNCQGFNRLCYYSNPIHSLYTAAHDLDNVDDQVDIIIAVVEDSFFQGTKARIAVTIGDDDDPGLIVAPSTLTIKEGDPVGGTFEVQLSEAPLGDFGNNDVTVSIPLRVGILTADKSSLTFTANNWNVSQEVTLIAGHDDDFVNDSEEILLEASGGGYDLERGRVFVKIIDDDEPKLEINPKSITVEEGEPISNFFDIRLAAQPTGEVTVMIPVFTNTALSRSPATLMFSASNYDDPQSVKVSAAPDDNTRNETETLSLTASGGGYDHVTGEVKVTVLDTGMENLVIYPSSLMVREGDERTFTVALSTKPLSAVTVVMSAFTNPELTRDPEELIFTPSTWATPQRVRVSAKKDDDAEQDPVEMLTLTALGGGYTGIFGEVQVTIEETDLKGIQLNPASLEITEGGPVGTYTVMLTSAPTSEVEITLRGDETKATLTPMSLRFHSSNWKDPQTVRVEAVQDRDLDDETLTVLHTASGGGYDGERAELALRITDQMPVTISIYDAQGQERAGRVDLRVELNRSTEVPITVRYETVAGTATSGEDYVRSRGLVIFDPGSRAGQIQIELIPDEIAEQEEQFTVRLANARPAGQVSIARPEGQVTIFDAARALAVRIDDAVMRGERVQFAVQLSAPSATSVRVHYRTEDQTARAGEDYHASIGVLTFAPGEWEQTIEVDLVPGRAPWQGKTFGMRLEHTTEGTIEKAMAVAMIQEESPSPEVEVMRAHAVRFVRTSTIQVVEGLRSRPTSSSCRAAERMGLVQLWGARSRWRPSLGELLSGCRVVQEQGVDRGWLSVWGQGAFTRFHGRGEEVLNLRGEVTTAMLGTDYRWPSGWRTGLLVTHSLGEGSYRRLAESGQVQSSLTQVVPYVSVQWVDWEAWLALGYGRGQTEVASLEGRLVSVFGAAGVEGTWRSTRRAGWTLHGDVLVAEAEVNQYEVRGEVIRVRVGVQGVLRVHETIRPYMEANVRQDGGHAETGTGLELGGGLRFASGQVKAEVRTQGLVMHTAEGFTEWGASGVVQVGGSSTGWGMTIRPSWGPTYGDRLHRQQTILDVTSSAANLYRTEVELAYGAPMKSGVARSVVGVTQMPHGRMYRVGTQLHPWDRMRVSVFGLAHSRRNLGLNVRGALSY